MPLCSAFLLNTNHTNHTEERAMETVTLSDVNVGTIEFDETRGGTTVAKFSVADNHRNRDGEETTAWTRCKAYG